MRGADSRSTRPRGRKSAPLAVAARDEDERGVESVHRRDRGPDVGTLGVVVPARAPARPTSLAAVREPAERPQRALDRAAADADLVRDGHRGECVQGVVAAGEGQLVQGNPAVAAGREPRPPVVRGEAVLPVPGRPPGEGHRPRPPRRRGSHQARRSTDHSPERPPPRLPGRCGPSLPGNSRSRRADRDDRGSR